MTVSTKPLTSTCNDLKNKPSMVGCSIILNGTVNKIEQFHTDF